MDLNHVLRKFFKEIQVLKVEVAVVSLQGNKSYDAIYTLYMYIDLLRSHDYDYS